MSRSFSRGFVMVAGLSPLALAGCGWDTAQGRYDTYQAFEASGNLSYGLIPAALVPKSARAIDVEIITDMDEVTLDFDFAPGDRAALVAGFEAVPTDARRNIDDKPWFDQRDAGAVLLRRCSAERVELLAVGKTSHAHYQSTSFPDFRAAFCAGTTPASPA